MKFDFGQKNIIKTSLAVIFTAVFLVAVCLSVVGAQTTREGIVNVTGGNRLNIRADAGTDYSTVGSLGEGEVIPILAEKTGTDGMIWYMTEHNGIVGYVRSDYIIVKKQQRMTRRRLRPRIRLLRMEKLRLPTIRQISPVRMTSLCLILRRI